MKIRNYLTILFATLAILFLLGLAGYLTYENADDSNPVKQTIASIFPGLPSLSSSTSQATEAAQTEQTEAPAEQQTEAQTAPAGDQTETPDVLITPETHIVTVNDGQVSGDFTAGSTMTVTANDRTAEGYQFGGWYVDSMNASLDDAAALMSVVFSK